MSWRTPSPSFAGVTPRYSAMRLFHVEGRSFQGSLAERRPLVRRVDALLVEAVPGLVHAPEERAAEVALLVARGEAHVARRERGAERVRGHVEPPRLEVEAHGADHREAELLLAVDRV